MKWNEAVKCSVGKGGSVFMEKVNRSSKWWEVKDWGESVSELMIKKNNYNKLYTVLSGCFYLLYMLYSNLSHMYRR